MIMDFDTRNLKLKKDDIFIFDGKKMSVIQKSELLKPLYNEIEKMKTENKIKAQELKTKFEDFKSKTIKELITR